MFALDAALDTVGTPHRLAVYAGGHGWPPEDGFSDAIAWFDLQAMRAGTLPKDPAFIEARFAACKQAMAEGIDALERWHTGAGCVRDFDGLRDVTALRADALALGASTQAKRLRTQDETLANEERRYLRRVDAWRQRFGRRFVEGIEQPPLPLSETLRQLTVSTLKKNAADPDPRVAASAQRQLAWAHVAAAFYMPAYFEGRGDHNRVVALQEVADATAWPGD
jgi:hypothetical protein